MAEILEDEGVMKRGKGEEGRGGERVLRCLGNREVQSSKFKVQKGPLP
jgi:hypothetical protein